MTEQYPNASQDAVFPTEIPKGDATGPPPGVAATTAATTPPLNYRKPRPLEYAELDGDAPPEVEPDESTVDDLPPLPAHYGYGYGVRW